MQTPHHLSFLIAIMAFATTVSALTEEEENTIAALASIQTSVVMVRIKGLEVDSKEQTIREIRGSGSGFAIGEGRVVTNYHVIEKALRITVLLSDGREENAWIVGTSPEYDLALLGVPFTAKELPTAALGSSDDLRVGQKVLAISNPLGLQQSVSRGVISGLHRSLPNLELGSNLIQFDASINMGQSGGPLIDSDGKVVGVTNAKIVSAEAIGFAIPINIIRRVIPELESMGHIFRPPLGFTGSSISPESAALFLLPVEHGILVERVEEDSLAAQIGLRAGHRHITFAGREIILGGDIIVNFEGKAIHGALNLEEFLMEARPGQKIKLTVIDANGKSRELNLVVPEMKH